MGQRSKQVDLYILKSKPFAIPILEHLRDMIHDCSDEIEEAMKWSFPHFLYKGNLCHMASFKEHCAFGFWKGTIMKDPKGILNPLGKTAMGHLGRISDVRDLPSGPVLKTYIKQAMLLNDKGIELPKKPAITTNELVVPKEFAKALKQDKKADEVFKKFSPSHKKEYIEWINEAKREETRLRRIETAIEWISEGKGKNWKYERK